MTWDTTRVLVTGAGGFIGSHLTERLVTVGAPTRALVRYSSSGTWGWLDESPHKDDIEVIAGDIRDPSVVRKAMSGVDVVFHLAALIAIPYSYQAPVSYVQTNVEGTLNVLEAARELGTNRVVHTSTSEVYGSARSIPITEDHPLQGQSPYAATKIGADKLAEAYHRTFGLPVVTLRPFNTFGPRQSARAVIPTIIIQLQAGSRVRLGNVHPTRDLNYVSNTVDGFLKAAQSPGAVGRTIHLGSGQEISIQDLAVLIGRLVGREVAIEMDPGRQRPETSEVGRLIADNRLAQQVLEWKPAVSLEEGLRRTIDWVSAHRTRYREGVYAV